MGADREARGLVGAQRQRRDAGNGGKGERRVRARLMAATSIWNMAEARRAAGRRKETRDVSVLGSLGESGTEDNSACLGVIGGPAE